MEPSSFAVTPPLDMVMPDAQVGLSIIWGIAALVSVIYCIRRSLLTKSWLAVNVLIGSGLAMFGESLVIQNMHTWYPAVNQIVGYTAFGHSVPLFACLAYLFYFAPGILIMIDKIEQGMTHRQFWSLWLGAVVFTIGYEVAGLSYDLWMYYGYQPFSIWKMPLTWPIINTMTFIPFAVILYFAKPYLKGGWMWLVIPAMATTVPTFEVMVAYPLFVAINSDIPDWAADLAALAAIGMTLATLAVCAKLACERVTPRAVGNRAASPLATGHRS